ncbi:MAG TPA: recombination protein NinG, partial [Candidatus Paceibacterota bacterium]
MTPKPPKPKKCRSCGEKFTPTRSTQVACSISCAITHARAVNAKRSARELREAKAKLKSRRDWMREAQAVFNRFIRLRDAGHPCISCGRHHQGQIHAGHFLSVGARPELRFDEANVHAQCAPCNNHLSGNIVLYRKGLIAKIGLEEVERLEGDHEPKKY